MWSLFSKNCNRGVSFLTVHQNIVGETILGHLLFYLCYIYICIYMYTHTHTHTHIYIYIYLFIYFCLFRATPAAYGSSEAKEQALSWDVSIGELSQGFFLFFLFCFLGLQLWHMEVPRLGVELEVQLPTCITATAMRDPSHVYDLHQAHGNARSLTH